MQNRLHCYRQTDKTLVLALKRKRMWLGLSYLQNLLPNL